MMRGLRTIAVLSVILFAQPLFADFASIASGLRSLGFQRSWIPFIGLARTLVRVVQPKGVHDFQMALFEHTPAVTGSRIAEMLSGRLGAGFTPLVRVSSARKRESVFVFVRPSRNDRTVELLVLVHEPRETVLVRLTADAETIARELRAPEMMGHLATR